MAEEGHGKEIEHQIECTMRSRLQHFNDQADSLTLETVRRLLEKDLGLENFALDVHKKFIKQYLAKLMDGTGDCNSKPSTENVDKDVNLSKDEGAISLQLKEKSPKRSRTEDKEMMEDSPIMGVSTPKLEASTQGSSVSESLIKKAIWERADHFLANSENLTLVGARRLLEEDLELDKNALDPFKKFISQQIDQVLNPPEGAKSSKDINKRTPGSSCNEKMEKTNHEEGSDTSGSESDKKEEKVKPRKKFAPRRKNKVSEEMKKRKRPRESDLDDSRMNKKKFIKKQKQENSHSDDHGILSEDDQSQPTVKKSAERKDKSAPGYGEKVEHLKSIIKACGMGVAPTIYKKAKEVPDNKREAFIIKELEGILKREGLSKNPTEKEIKECKKRKETARELEGIDMTNIISSSRRRSTFSIVAPPKVEIRAATKKVEGKNAKNKKNNDKERTSDSEEMEKKKEEEEDKQEKEDGDKHEDKEEDKEEEEEDKEEEEDEENEEDVDDESEEFNEDDSDGSD